MINFRKTRGLTLLELTVTLTLLSLLISIASASYEPLVIDSRTRTVISELRGLVLLTRSEAVKRGHRTVLCPSVDGIRCADDWSGRLILFPDPDNNLEAASATDVLKDRRLVSDGEKLTYNRKALIFSSLGRTSGTNGTFIYCWDHTAATAHAMIVSRLGRLRQATDYDRDGIREKRPGEPLSCPG